jgi:hypothetical protein
MLKKEAVILSAAKDLLGGPTAYHGHNILRCAQDDRRLETTDQPCIS